METDAVLASLGVREDTLTDADRRALDERGVVAFPSLFPREYVMRLLAAVETRFAKRTLAEGRDGGTLHLKDLEEIPEVDAVWQHPRMLAAARYVLGPAMRLRGVQYRAPRPGFGGQALHADWGWSVTPGDWQVCTAMVPLVDVDARTGPTRVVPGSHREGRLVLHASPDECEPGEERLVGAAGSVFVFNGHVRHSGTRNDSDRVRHALLLNFGRGATTMTAGPSDATLDRLGDAAWLFC